MLKRILSKALVMLLAVLMVVSGLTTAVFAAASGASLEAAVEASSEETKESSTTKLEKIKELLNSNTYTDYRKIYEKMPNGKDNITVNGVDYNPNKTDAEVYTDRYLGSENEVLLIPELGDVTWDFEVATSGNYHIEFTYAPVDTYDQDADGTPEITSNSSTVERALLIDGAYPFKQSRYIQLTRVWGEITDEGANERGFVLDNDGSEIRPKKVEMPEWRVQQACDSTGYITDPFLYYIEAGSHTLTLAEVQEPVAIASIRIYYDNSVREYSQYLKLNEGKPDRSASASPVYIEGEKNSKTSSNIIYPIYDRSSSATSPQSAYNIYLNIIGGNNWQTVGQWISWEIDIPEDGYYCIAPRFDQGYAEGMYVTREIRIDGKVPFKEAKALRFKYDDDWQLAPLTDGAIDEVTGKERALQFYFEKGKHTIELDVSLGSMAAVLTEVEDTLTKINECYLQILMLTGSDPDEYRDYQFARLMPEAIKGMAEQSKRLYAISAELEAINGTKGSDSVTLDNVALLLERMSADEDNIAPNFSTLKDYIGTLGTWIMNTRNQPLSIDYMVIYPATADSKQIFKDGGYTGSASFWSAAAYEFKQFIMSWISDYSSYGVRTAAGSDDYPSIEVWTTSGRDQSTIMRSLVSDSFTQKYNVAVEIKLVAAGSLLPATLSGLGPDVNMTTASATVINYAIRSALMPVNPAGYVDKEGDSPEKLALNAKCREIFSDYDEVMSWFADAATIPLQLYGVAYALPETESFSMMFYRSDILLQLGLEIPETWKDVYNMLPTLQTNNLQFGYHESLAGLLIMLYQRGESLYKAAREDDPTGVTFGMQINLDSNTSLETFKDLCEMYTMYGFPYSYNFVNRFRTGEMPIGVAAYSIYSQLTIFAPELRGLWGFTILPGTLRTDKDGNAFVDHTADTTMTGVCMMNGCDEIQAAWDFMKWWVSAETQGTYGQEYYALLGASGQYTTANLNALYAMSWTAEERAQLHKQFAWLRATPEMPGGYIVTRYVEFAFLRAYNDDENPVEAILDYIDTINAELTRKRSEFGLPTLEDYETAADNA